MSISCSLIKLLKRLCQIQLKTQLFYLVTRYHMHSHSKSCRKYKNGRCRYHFGNFFTDHSVTDLPLHEDLPEDVRNNILTEREGILTKVKQYIDSNLE